MTKLVIPKEPPTPEVAAALAFVADNWIAHIRHQRMAWMMTPPLGNTLFLTRCFSRNSMRLAALEDGQRQRRA